ncbi:hypothetical protein G6F60_015191 [Rhizopus arrhizus]|nr:hypothetical protein G6F32_015176 [Rhizopus arrhizus]KAG1224416.1 hypothetical protein G6F68_020117 [Rhizopus microsporus]KAG1380577.1 hypothetical protein G6F60_015191 [Rhizopus arrhizus]
MSAPTLLRRAVAATADAALPPANSESFVLEGNETKLSALCGLLLDDFRGRLRSSGRRADTARKGLWDRSESSLSSQLPGAGCHSSAIRWEIDTRGGLSRS